MGPESWMAIVGIIVVVGSNAVVLVRLGQVTKAVEVLGKQSDRDRDEHLRMWEAIDVLPRVTTQIESLMEKVEGLVQSDRERIAACAKHATLLGTFDDRLAALGKQ
jgi:hypothetical protein